MKRGTTPTHTFTVNRDLKDAVKIYITYRQNGLNILEKNINDITIDGYHLSVTLTQDETLRFCNGKAEIQIRYVMPDGTADVSEIMHVPVYMTLKEGEI